MKLLSIAWFALGLILFTFFTPQSFTKAETVPQPDALLESTEPAQIYVFGRDECGFCKELFAYLEEENLPFDYLNLNESDYAASLYDQVTSKHQVTKVTPVIVIGEKIIVGFNGPRTTGEQIKSALVEAETSSIRSVEQHIAEAPVQSVTIGGGCTGISCDEGEGASSQFVFELPLLGIVDLRSFSLISLSFILGVIDGFNPCAMWVLITFLVLLSQAGSRKKMIFLAGIFIVAQGIMYNLILNVWYKTWDFVALDHVVTPLVGFLAVGGALFFLWRWYKNREVQLVCDITDIETQSRTIDKFKKIVEQPVTIASVLAILAIAFSVNIIEFACSIGIPQAYTKILEMNALPFLERQWYLIVFSLGYMLDDVVVFGLAIWGYSRLQSHGGKYAQLSLLIGGILMLILGGLLIFNPSLLVL